MNNNENKPLFSIQRNGNLLYSLSYQDKLKLITVGDFDGNIFLYNIEGILLLNQQIHKKYIISIKFSPNGNMIASGSADHTVVIQYLNINTFQIYKTKIIEDNQNFIMSIDFSPNNENFITASCDRSIHIYDTINFEQKLKIEWCKAVCFVKFVNDNSFYFSTYDFIGYIDIRKNNKAILKQYINNLKTIDIQSQKLSLIILIFFFKQNMVQIRTKNYFKLIRTIRKIKNIPLIQANLYNNKIILSLTGIIEVWEWQYPRLIHTFINDSSLASIAVTDQQIITIQRTNINMFALN